MALARRYHRCLLSDHASLVFIYINILEGLGFWLV